MKMKGSKKKNARIVKFKADWPAKGKKIYAKDSEHAIHADLVAKLEKRGAKMDVKKVDWETVYEKAQVANEKAKQKAGTLD